MTYQCYLKYRSSVIHQSIASSPFPLSAMKSKMLITKPEKKQMKKWAKKRLAASNTVNLARGTRRIRAQVYLAPEDYPSLTDPKQINCLVVNKVHKNLTRAYQINGCLPMCFIFDHISPACLFKHGTTYGPNTLFA